MGKVRAGNQNNLGWFSAGGKWQLNPAVEFDMETTVFKEDVFSPGLAGQTKRKKIYCSETWIVDGLTIRKKPGTDQNGQALQNNRSYIRLQLCGISGKSSVCRSIRV